MLLKKLLSISIFFPVVTHASPALIELNNGDKLTAEIIEQNENTITLSHAVLGQVSIDTTQIVAINDTAIGEQTSPEPDDAGLFSLGLLTGWQRQFNLGISGSAGKSREQNINLAFEAEFEDKATRIDSKTAYFSARSEGERTDNSFFSSINRDWLKPDSPWLSFAGGRFDWDEFKDWDYRLSANSGIGYEFIDSDTFLVVGRVGVNANQTFGGEREEFTPEALLGIESKWVINGYQKLKFSNTLYPSLKDSSEFRNLSSLDWQLDLNTVHGVALKLGLLNEYDSATEDDISKNDFKYTASLSWQL